MRSESQIPPLPTEEILRYGRQVVLKAMDQVRNSMRGSRRLEMARPVKNQELEKADENPTLGIDREAEQLMIAALHKKLAKLDAVKPYTIFSEEAELQTFPDNTEEDNARLVIFVDPIDGTEFAEALQGGWTLLAFYDRWRNETVAAIAGDIFLDRIYWASESGAAEGLDFITHSWFRLDGGPAQAKRVSDARINVLTTKPSRYRALAEQKRLLAALSEGKGRVNLSWGSNTIIQVAAGYADVSLEFAKGFATYDILPGLYIGLKAGLTLLDLDGNKLSATLDIPEIFHRRRTDPKNPVRTPFIATKHESLAREVLSLIDK